MKENVEIIFSSPHLIRIHSLKYPTTTREYFFFEQPAEKNSQFLFPLTAFFSLFEFPSLSDFEVKKYA